MSDERDMFNNKRAPKADAVFSNGNTILTFGGEGSDAGGGIVGYMVQGWSVQYQQQVQEVFELGSDRLYWSKGRPVGGGNISRVIGPRGATGGGKESFFPEAAFDACQGGARFKMSAKGGNCEESGTKMHGIDITMDGVLVLNLGFQTNVQDTRLMESVAFRHGFMMVTSRAA